MNNTVFNINNSEIKQFATTGMNTLKIFNCKFQKDDEVIKDSGDYKFEGKIVSVFTKLSGHVRIVVEDDRGLLFIFNETQLKYKNEQSVNKESIYLEGN